MNPDSAATNQKPIVGVGVVILRPGTPGPDVLLIQRGKAPRAGEWSIPGGRQEWGETLMETAHREIREETGLTITNLRLIDVVDGLMRGAGGDLERHLTLVNYLAEPTGGTLAAGDDAIDARWVPLADILKYGLWRETTRIIRAGAAMAEAPSEAIAPPTAGT